MAHPMVGMTSIQSKHILLLGLLILLMLGFVNGLQLSIANAMGTSCPAFAFIPVCYVVTLGYGLMLFCLPVRRSQNKRRLFYSGWVVVAGIAALASFAQLFGTDPVCPTGAADSDLLAGVPLCYVSLAISLLIVVLYEGIYSLKR